MGTNRSTINNSAIIYPTQLLDKGIPFPFLEGRFVKLTRVGVRSLPKVELLKKILEPGTYFLGKYRLFRDVKATKVDMRVKTMEMMTWDEFQISQPVPVGVDLTLSVEYRVADARRVVTEVTTPLGSLFDRVIKAVRGSIVHTHVDEIRTQGEGIARTTLGNLKAMLLPNEIGIEVLNVLTTKIKATDTGNDALATFQKEQLIKVQTARIDNELAAQTNLSPAWFALYRPELYAQMMAGNTEVISQLIDKGLLDPAGFLNQSANSSGLNQNLTNSFTQNLLGIRIGNNQINQSQISSREDSTKKFTSPSVDSRSRVKEDIKFLKTVAGAKIEWESGSDENNEPDGTFRITVAFPRNSGGEITTVFTCSENYPKTPPELEVQVNSEETSFQSPTLRRWTSSYYLVEIVREAKQYFG